MKLSAQEEYGLRCLLQMARHEARTEGESLTLAEISQRENLSIAHVGKIMRLLRLSGFVVSERGKLGGYRLARPVDEIRVKDVIAALGGPFYDGEFCGDHAGQEERCTHTVDCSIRSLWNTVQTAVDQVLGEITLKDMMRNEAGIRTGLRAAADEELEVSG
jgi:Rrf2 family protein